MCFDAITHMDMISIHYSESSNLVSSLTEFPLLNSLFHSDRCSPAVLELHILLALLLFELIDDLGSDFEGAHWSSELEPEEEVSLACEIDIFDQASRMEERRPDDMVSEGSRDEIQSGEH